MFFKNDIFQFIHSFIHSFARIHHPYRPGVVSGTTDRAVNKKILVPTLPEITVWRPTNNKVNKAISIVTTVLKRATGEVCVGANRMKSISDG